MPLNNSRYRALFMLVSAQRIGFTTGHAVNCLNTRFQRFFQQKGWLSDAQKLGICHQRVASRC